MIVAEWGRRPRFQETHPLPFGRDYVSTRIQIKREQRSKLEEGTAIKTNELTPGSDTVVPLASPNTKVLAPEHTVDGGVVVVITPGRRHSQGSIVRVVSDFVVAAATGRSMRPASPSIHH